MGQENHTHQPLSAGNICLIGLMGSGKSTIGPLLAQRLGYTFVDLDGEISMSMKRPIREIFEQLGEEKFRIEECVQLRRFCQQEQQVIACGGGVVVTPDNLECLRRQITVYLKASPETLANRIGPDKERPMLKGAVSVAQRLATILSEREPWYQDCAKITLLTEGKDPNTLVGELLAQLPPGISSPVA
ncbi:MAG: shikimate kinase [Fidelibacterota bacterium]|nr:MAG: shikimate kinase [Candidatus Neomarinimicrobiota bacterium]